MSQRIIIALLITANLAVVACTGRRTRQKVTSLEFKMDSLIEENDFRQRELIELDSFICELSLCIDSVSYQEIVLLSKKDSTGRSLSNKVIMSNLTLFEDLLERQRLKVSDLEDSIRMRENFVSHLLPVVSFVNLKFDEKDRELDRMKKEMEEKAKAKSNNSYVPNVGIIEKDIYNQVDINDKQDEMPESATTHPDNYQICVMSKKDLKSSGYLVTYLLNYTLDESKIDNLQFQEIDPHTFQEFTVESKKVKILTSVPSDSYSVKRNADGSSTIKILDVDKFWSKTKKLVVQYE